MAEQFKRLSLDDVCQSLCENKNTLIVYHIRSDADAVGSAFALRELMHTMGIPAYCACSDEIPERLRFLVEGIQGSVLLEEGLMLDCERVISVDSASPSQLGEMFERLHKNIDIMVDHHSSGTVYADNYIDSEASSTGEIVYVIAKRLCELGMIEELPKRAMRCIYAAMSSDTGGFRYANTTPKSLRIAAELVDAGVDIAEINRSLFDSKPIKQIMAEGEAIKRLCLYKNGKIASTVIPYEVKRELELSDEHLGTLIDIPRSICGVEIAFAVKQENEGGIFRVSMRSATEFDVSAVCAVFGGGGHKRASGCTVKADTVEEAKKIILDEICKRL